MDTRTKKKCPASPGFRASQRLFPPQYSIVFCLGARTQLHSWQATLVLESQRLTAEKRAHPPNIGYEKPLFSVFCFSGPSNVSSASAGMCRNGEVRSGVVEI